jgi:hypothetical protein
MAEPSDIAEVIKGIQNEITTIVRGEIALATDEIKTEATKAGIIAGLFGGAGYLALSALAVLFSAFGFLWAVGFQHWFALDLLASLFWGFLVMGVLMLALSGLLGFIGTKAPQPGPPAESIASAQDQIAFVKSTIAEANAEVARLPLNGDRPATGRPELD